jgi:phosphoglucomutase
MDSLEARLQQALSAGTILPATAENVLFLVQSPSLHAWEKASIEELVSGGHWTELNDRFYKTLTFGTGGLRGRTIGKHVTAAERGTPAAEGRPEHPAVGTNAMNDFNINRAVQGLMAYLKQKFPGEQVQVVFAHDTRHFSKEFAGLAARIVATLGGRAWLFPSDRPTPQLSFTIRWLKAHAGAVITASHNPAHDNGFKVYFQDGAQIVEPHASGIIKEVLAVQESLKPSPDPSGQVSVLGPEADAAFLQALETSVLDRDGLAAGAGKLRIVYSPIHGTGARAVPAVLRQFGFTFSTVAAQDVPDGRFPTVASPNPENAETLQMAVDQAAREGADLVMATDPDADRMGAAVRTAAGGFQLLNGNQIGSILAAYRLETMFRLGWLTPANAGHAALIKTFVTTDLQKEIAAVWGVKCVETLTGFKYIGEKLGDYEKQAGGRGDLDLAAWRERLLAKSTFFVFGGEESYGYLGGDYARDKDAAGSVLMLAEVAAVLKAKGRTLLDYLEEIYRQYGYYAEKLGTLTFEGAEGAAKIKRLVEGYRSHPPTEWAGVPVTGVQNFAEDRFVDIDGKPVPAELMLIFHLKGGARVAVRGSGTEPKIKYYFFLRQPFAPEMTLTDVETEATGKLDFFWAETRRDVGIRIS